jgi:hypothetical protein
VSSVFVCATLAAWPPPRQKFQFFRNLFFLNPKFQYYVIDSC